MYPGRETNRDRITSALGVAAIHAVLGYALIRGLGFDPIREVVPALKVFDVAPRIPPPPPIEEPPPAPASDAAEGAASPPNLKSVPSPVVAPIPKIRLEIVPPIVAAPVPGPGSAPSAGASDIAGPGTGAGGEGTGTGSGRAGDGAGGGGIAKRPRYLRGRLSNSDYPRKAGDDGVEGVVTVHFTVGADGRVSGCKVVDSSGNGELDSTTCTLIERRFRYEPARDGAGRPVADVTGWKQEWWIGPRKR